MPESTIPPGSQSLDAETCFRAYETRDARFDGRFFVAVRTTGIFCRPICPARTPLRRNVEFHASAASAFESGFRPCLRCRPERAPRAAGVDAPGAALVARALDAIDGGALDEASLEALSARIGVTARHLRRLFAAHLGASPSAVAQTRRLIFARQLIEETALPMTQVAFAAGFASIRRFNAALLAAYGAAPATLRRPVPRERSNRRAGNSAASGTGLTVTLTLARLAEANFLALTGFYRARAFAGAEIADGVRYARTIRIGATSGTLTVRHEGGTVLLETAFPEAGKLPHIVARVKRMFDLTAPLAAIATHLATDKLLRPALANGAPHVPCAWDPYELALRAVLGQQVSVAAATTLAGRLVRRFGAHFESEVAGLDRLFPAPAAVAALEVDDLTALGIVRARAACIVGLAHHVAEDPHWRDRYTGLDTFVTRLTALPGIGPWTAQYVAMRGFGDPDAFPAADLGLLRAARSLSLAQTPRELDARSERWRPWRAYAAQALWNYNTEDSA